MIVEQDPAGHRKNEVKWPGRRISSTTVETV